MKALRANGTWQPKSGYVPAKREIEDKRAIWGNLIFKEPSIEFVEIPVPVPKPDEVLLKVGGVGVCGSDTAFTGKGEDGYSLYAGHCKLPCVIGHEFSGEIVETGKDVMDFKVGDIVTAETMNWCGKCRSCRMGMFNQCERLEEIGFTLNGGYAEYMIAKEKYCIDINVLLNVYGTKDKALEAGALIEPLAVAYNNIFTRGGGIRPGDNVAIFGCGPIGMSALLLSKVSGAATIIVFELIDERVQLAKELGADFAFNSNRLIEQGKTPTEVIMEITKGTGAMVQIEATEAHNETMPFIEDAISVGAKVIEIGIDSEKTDIMLGKFQKKGSFISTAIGSAGHGIWYAVIRLISSGRIDPAKMITKCYGLDNALTAIDEARQRKCGKIVVKPNKFT